MTLFENSETPRRANKPQPQQPTANVSCTTTNDRRACRDDALQTTVIRRHLWSEEETTNIICCADRGVIKTRRTLGTHHLLSCQTVVKALMVEKEKIVKPQ